MPVTMIERVLEINDARKQAMADRIAEACGGSVADKTIAVLGLTFKPNTDDMRESPSLSILPPLVEAGATIRAFDPEGMHEAKKLLPNLDYCDDAYQAIDGADALVLLTEWNEFRGLDLERIKSLMRAPIVIDLRDIYQPQDMANAGLVYHSIGRTTGTPPSALGSLKAIA